MALELLELAENGCAPAEADFPYFVAFVSIAAFKFMAASGKRVHKHQTLCECCCFPKQNSPLNPPLWKTEDR